MLRLIVLFLSFMTTMPLYAQRLSSDVEYVAFGKNTLSPKELSQQLTEGKLSEYEKVRSIFQWITDNIAYRSRFYSRRHAPAQTEDDTASVLKPLNERVAEIVLKNGVAVCDGYARLFKTLCDHAGIRAEIITGHVRNLGRGSMRFQSNHSWNAVMIDGKWHLADPTWASGHITSGGQFVRHYDASFFLADPERLLSTHYPENPFWTLLPDHRPAPEFRSQPLKYFSWHQYYITSHSPSSGIIDAKEGEPIVISLQTTEPKKDLVITTDLFQFGLSEHDTVSQRDFQVTGNNIKGTYIPGRGRPQWLYVALNGDVVMRYQLRYKSL